MSDLDPSVVNVPEFLRRLDAGWDDLTRFIAGLTLDQLTGPADAAGWTVKDHLMHLAVWEDGMNALLTGQSRQARMGVDEATWASADYDAINAVIQQAHRDRSLDDVLQAFNQVHDEFRGRIAALSTPDLFRPYADYQPGSSNTDPVVHWLAGNSIGHYEEHLPWMQAIVEKR